MKKTTALLSSSLVFRCGSIYRAGTRSADFFLVVSPDPLGRYTGESVFLRVRPMVPGEEVLPFWCRVFIGRKAFIVHIETPNRLPHHWFDAMIGELDEQSLWQVQTLMANFYGPKAKG